MTEDDTPGEDEELPPELDVWESIEEKLTETLDSHKEAILSEIDQKIEEARSQIPSPEGYDEFKTTIEQFKEETEESIESLDNSREQMVTLWENLYAQQGYEAPTELEEEEDEGEDNENEDNEEKE